MDVKIYLFVNNKYKFFLFGNFIIIIFYKK